MTASLPAEARPLLALIDAGDDETLPLLADALEEAGDRRAAGLRVALASRREPMKNATRFGMRYDWVSGAARLGGKYRYQIPTRLHRLLPMGDVPGLSQCYSTRSEAFLALAEALSPVES